MTAFRPGVIGLIVDATIPLLQAWDNWWMAQNVEQFSRKENAYVSS